MISIESKPKKSCFVVFVLAVVKVVVYDASIYGFVHLFVCFVCVSKKIVPIVIAVVVVVMVVINVGPKNLNFKFGQNEVSNR